MDQEQTNEDADPVVEETSPGAEGPAEQPGGGAQDAPAPGGGPLAVITDEEPDPGPETWEAGA